jgi:hypothetical protein
MLILSCSESVGPLPDAEYMTIEEILASPASYFWFKAEFDSYFPDTTIVAQIQVIFDLNRHKVIYFAKPSCSCSRSQKAFPAMVRILKDANIPDTCSEIYSMIDTKAKHPFQDKITLHQLPSIYILKDGLPVYSLKDTLDNLRTIDPDSGKVEVLLLDALRK